MAAAAQVHPVPRAASRHQHGACSGRKAGPVPRRHDDGSIGRSIGMPTADGIRSHPRPAAAPAAWRGDGTATVALAVRSWTHM
eukprot:2353091-Prymnesium_polylepis.1